MTLHLAAMPSCFLRVQPSSISDCVQLEPGSVQTAHFTIVKVLKEQSSFPQAIGDQVSQRVLTLHPSKLTRSGLCHLLRQPLFPCLLALECASGLATRGTKQGYMSLECSFTCTLSWPAACVQSSPVTFGGSHML